jgi:L-ornithine N5-monooxygenase
MKHREVELLAIGAGPSNLALAVAVEELAPIDLAEETLLIEQDTDVVWQRGMLLPWAQSQVSFLKDLVTLRNPRSHFSFINYLHDVGRLHEFINLASFTPYRTEISDYLQWVARSLTRVRVEFGKRCVAIEPRREADGNLAGWLVRLADGTTIGCRYLTVGAGRDPHVPGVFAGLPPERLIHSTQYRNRIAELDPTKPLRLFVIGGAQSAAEMLSAAHEDLPESQSTMIMRSIGLGAYQTSKFTNELYYPSFVDEFYASRPEARSQMLHEMHRTNYSGLAPDLLESLYRKIYLQRMAGTQRLRIITMADVTEARLVDDEVILRITDRKSGDSHDLSGDFVLLGTGFVRDMPKVVRELAASLGLDDIAVSRSYRLIVPGPASAGCYLQGVNEATHGIADSLLSVLALRAEDIATDIMSLRAAPALLSAA